MTTAESPAYPIEVEDGYYLGLLKRELFAAMAMQGMASCGAFARQHIEYDSERAVMIADALIAELNKEVQP